MPNIAFLSIIAGILLIYCEFIWLGKLIFGLVGAITTLIGICLLLRSPTTSLGEALIALSICCFLLEAMIDTRWLAGSAASILLAAGFCKLCDRPAIWPQLAFPLCALFGVITTGLLHFARKARQNKTAL